jgi:beta-carotene 15,15'-dioxygenase
MKENIQERCWKAVLIAAFSMVALAFFTGINIYSTLGFFVLLPWIVSLFLWGLPHGAADHFLLARLVSGRSSLPVVLYSALSYLAVAVLVFIFWSWQPVWAFTGFILLTLVHWGAGDLWWSWTRDSSLFPDRGSKIFFLLWRGALPMLVPLVVAPESYRLTAEAATGFWPHGHDWMWLESSTSRIIAGFVVLALGIGYWWRSPRNAGNHRNHQEDLSLLLFFIVVPTLPALGLYFTFWHGWRHVLRLQGKVNGGKDQCLGVSFWKDTWLTTAISLALLVVMAFSLSLKVSFLALLGLYLVLIACLTVPHTLVVTWMDLKNGIWQLEAQPKIK